MAFAYSNIVQHPHFEGAGAVYVVALTPKKAVWAAGAVFCGFRDGQVDRPGVECSACNCVRSCPDRQSDFLTCRDHQIDDMGALILTLATDGRMVSASAPEVRAVTAKSVAGIGTLSVKRRPNRAKSILRGFSMVGRMGPRKRATPFGGSSNPVRPATRDWNLRWLVNPVQTEAVMSDHDHGRNLPKTVTFQNTELSIIDRDGVPWISSADIARALGYARADKITRLYHRHKDEFTEAMTQTPEMGFSGNLRRKVRIFSPRGAQLIAMLAKTDRAKAFRRWVLDVLETQTAGMSAGAETRPAGPSIEHMQVVNDVVTIIMNKIGPQIAVSQPRTMPPLTRPDDPMPRLMDGHAVFRIGSKMVIVDTQDYDLRPGDRAVVLQVEDGEFPKVVTVQGKPPVKGWFDRCMIFDCGVNWLIPVGAVLGRVVWEGDCRG